VLAGGTPQPGEPLWAATGGAPKALLPLAGRPMIHWVLAALDGAQHIDRVVVAGLDTASAAEAGLLLAGGTSVEYLPDAGSLVANAYAAIARLTPGSPAAYCWSDIPLITADMIDRFIDGTTNPHLDINAGLVPKADLLGRYPGCDDLWLRVREGRFIAADFGLFNPANAERARRHLEVLMPQRKSAARQALYLGVPFLLRFVCGRLTIPALEAHLARRFDLHCHIRVVGDPELGLDVDNDTNLAVCRAALERSWS